MAKRNALGRGLGALIDNADSIRETSSNINEIEIRSIEANPFQPRSYFNTEALEELASSIKELGIIQPLTLRQLENGKYQIIAGERRFRASQMAGLTKVPAYVRKAKDDGMLEMALVENIQREDLDAIEIAFSYQRLIEECNLTQENLSTRVGKKRSTIANYLRLLKLPAAIQHGIREKHISMGHARALINIATPEKQISTFEEIINKDLSVRKVEEIVRSLNGGSSVEKSKKSAIPKEYQAAKNNLDSFFNRKVNLSVNDKGKGKIVIPFKSEEDLQKLLKLLGQ